MGDIIVAFNRTDNSEYQSHAKVNYTVAYKDNIEKKSTAARVTLKFYIKPDPYTYTDYTRDSLYIGIKKATSSATLIKKTISPTLTSGGSVAANTYNLVGSATFDVEYDSITTYPLHVYVGYTNQNTSRFAPFVMPQSGDYKRYDYVSGSQNKIVLEKRLTFTPCSMPSSLTAAPKIFGKSLSLTWGQSAGGVNNSLSDYELWYCAGGDKEKLGSWQPLTSAVGGGCTVSPSLPAGHYVMLRIRARGKAGKDYYSGFRESAVIQKAPESCTAPTSFTVSPGIFEGSVSLSWSGSAGKTNNKINSYLIQYAVSDDGVSFGAWTNLTAVTSASTSGSFKHNPSIPRGSFIKYQIQTRGTAGADYYSAFKVSGKVQKNLLPGASSFLTPSAALVKSGSSLNLSWGAVSHKGLSFYRVEKSVNGKAFTLLGETVKTSLTCICAEKPGSDLKFRVKAVDNLGVSGGYRESVAVKVNTPPLAPTGMKVSPTVFGNTEKLTLSFTESADVDKNVLKYEVGIKEGSSLKLIGSCTSSPYIHTVGAEFPEGKEVYLWIRAVDDLLEKSPTAVLETVLVKRDNTLSVGIDGKWMRKKLFVGENGKWNPKGIYKGVNGKWVKTSSLLENHIPKSNTEIVKSKSFTVEKTFEGSTAKGRLLASVGESPCLIESPRISVWGMGFGYVLELPCPLRGIKTQENSNFTDDKGESWLCDYYDLWEKKVVRVLNEDFNPITPQETAGKELNYPPDITCLEGFTGFDADGMIELEIKTGV